MISQVMCLHICCWGSMHTQSRHNALLISCFLIPLLPACTHNDINRKNGILNDQQNGVGFCFFLSLDSKSMTEFVTNVIEICQYYNFGHYQKTIEPYCTKESAL